MNKDMVVDTEAMAVVTEVTEDTEVLPQLLK